MKKDVLQMLGDRIRRARDNKKLTQANLAEELGMTASAFSKIEKGINNTPVKRLYQIAEVLGVNIIEFFSDTHMVSEPSEMQSQVTREEFIQSQENTKEVKSEVELLKEEMSLMKSYYKLRNKSRKPPKK